MSFKVPEHCRIREGSFASHPEIGCNGHFLMQGPFPAQYRLFIEASEKGGMQQVIVSRGKKPPSDKDMDFVMGFFWDKDDQVKCQLLSDNRRRRWWRKSPGDQITNYQEIRA